MTPFVLAWLVCGAPLAESAPAGALGWVETPAVARALAGLDASPLGPLVTVLLPRPERTLLHRARDAQLLAAAYPAPAPGAPRAWGLWLDGGAEAPAREVLQDWLEQRGYAPGAGSKAARAYAGPGGTVALLATGSRTGVTSRLDERSRAAGSLAASAEYRRLARSDRSELRAVLDVQQWYGELARSSQGRTLAGLVGRLGLLDARAVVATLDLDRATGASARLELLVPGEPRGLRAVFGPPFGAGDAAAVPSGALGFLRVSLSPKRLYELGQVLASYEAPLETALVRANVESLEARLGRRLGEHVLGEAPRAWTWYWTRAQSGPAVAVLVAELADTTAAALFVKELAGLVPGLFPELEASVQGAGGETVYLLREGGREVLAVGIGRDALVLSASASAVAAHLRREPGSERRATGHGAVAFARMTPAGASALLRSSEAGRVLLAAAAARGVGERELASALGDLELRLEPSELGLAATARAGRR